jgi:hypothetical protein
LPKKEISAVKKRGRPPGALNKKTRAVLELALKDGVTPPEAMLKIMRRWWKLTLKSEATGQMQRAADFCERAQDFAVAALPHFYRRLTRVRPTVDTKPTVVVLPFDEWQEEYAQDRSKDLPVIQRPFAGGHKVD